MSWKKWSNLARLQIITDSLDYVLVSICHIRTKTRELSPSLSFPALIMFKSFYAALWAMDYFPLYNPFPSDVMFLATCYDIKIFIAFIQMIETT